MKTFLTLLFILPLMTAAQDIRDSRHVFNYGVAQLPQCNALGAAVAGGNKEDMQPNWQFNVIYVVNSGKDYIIRVAKFTSGTKEANTQNTKTYGTESAPIYFKLSKVQYDASAEKLRSKGNFVVGASTTLIKVRPGNNKEGDDKIYADFGNDFNVGLTAGWQFIPYRKREVYITLVGGLSFSSIKVTPQTTRDFITSEATQSCLTFNGGLIFEIDKFQTSAFVGIDAMSGQVGEHWIYRNRPWFGLGFGYNIFQDKGKAKN